MTKIDYSQQHHYKTPTVTQVVKDKAVDPDINKIKFRPFGSGSEENILMFDNVKELLTNPVVKKYLQSPYLEQLFIRGHSLDKELCLTVKYKAAAPNSISTSWIIGYLSGNTKALHLAQGN